ncbi:type I restriction-modification system subunit M [Clostridium cochlearium]|uniref:site-specific DNA-methyltransferase (adenine-specific) n=1 Tax=Clostridium cochlearium TaxID=1494 RepID=A0A2X2W2B5_CLOCO|nr:type I restriction-modification system subunit M [Clostridium cochlearium]SQB35496.1 type I restriction system adenine methylase HsdM [Clostridium cochlearium]
MITSEEIKRRLWDGANELRGSMDASRYKDYMLGLMFYKFLSDKTLDAFRTSARLGKVTEGELVEEYKKAREKYGETLDKTIQSVLGYYVLPEYLYQTWIMDINTGDFEVQKVTDSLHNFERSVAIESGNDDFKGLFSSSTIDLTDTALGSNLNERSKNIQALIMLFADLNMVALQKGDILGEAYEYLIGQFAMESGKKAGEFYTPHQVSEVMAQIVAKSSNIESIYDPTVGSGSLLLTVGKHLDPDAQKNLNYYGQEKNTATYNLTRMNLLLHGVRPEKMTIRNGDTLSYDWPEDPEKPNEGVQFDAVVMNPPYSVKNWNRSGLKVSDPRFEIAGTLPPDSKGDFAFLLHGLFHLRQSGTMAIVLPHGILFRGGAEGEIRKKLIDKNYIDTIIGLPSNLFTNTGIPVVILILKKNRKLDEPVLVIDASQEFIKVGKQNVLQEKHIAKIVDTFVERRREEGYSSLVYREDILENDYNMNIPRYVIAKSDEISHDVDAHLLGGIPEKDIKNLKILNTIVPDTLANALQPLRTGYFELAKEISELADEIMQSEQVSAKSEEMKKRINEYIDKYWSILIKVDKQSNINGIMEDMLLDIKEILSSFEFISVYDGYQNIADIWKDSLTKDLELISLSDFYTVARTREPNMIVKGSGNSRREEQDGWISSLIPNELIVKQLYNVESSNIENLKQEVSEIEMELEELVEAAKVEGSDENEILYECLTKNKEGEAGNSFTAKAIKDELKEYKKDTDEYKLLKNVEKLMSYRTKINKEIREKEKELKELVEERILILTEEEIDSLVFEKWFGNLMEEMISLIEKPLKDELEILKMLDDRYKSTLNDLDEEYSELEASFESLLSELVRI